MRKIHTLLPLMTVAGFFGFVLINLWVDPFGLNTPLSSSVMAREPVAGGERLTLPGTIDNAKADLLLLGTSRMEAANMQHESLLAANAVNGSLGAATPYEMLTVLQHGICNGVDSVLVAYDFFIFSHTKEKTYGIFDAGLYRDKECKDAGYVPAMFRLHASGVAWEHSWSTLHRTVSGIQEKAEEEPATSVEPKINNRKALFLDTEFGFHDTHYASYHLSEAKLLEFEEALRLAHTHNIKMTLMLSPSHARLWEVLDFTIGFEVLEEWKRKMVQINEEVAAEYNNPPFVFWDFTGYHELTTEAVPAPDSASQEMEWHYETSHYKPALSDVVFDRIYGLDTPYEDFGRVIHSGNIDEHLSTLRDERREWTEAYREALQEMRSYLRESTQNAL